MKKLRRRFSLAAGVVLALNWAGAASALEMGVFGDMSLASSNAPSSEPGFRLGSLDLYALQYIDDKTKALFETQFQTFSGGPITVEIQRFQIMREVNDHFHIGIGRFHTPLGYWNTHFHHGILLQDTVTRPFFLGFEGNNVNALWPIHLVGIMAEGDIAGGFRYEAAVANSNTINSSIGNNRLTIPNRADLGAEKSLFGRLRYDVYDRPFKPGIFFLKNDVLDSSPGTTATGGDFPLCTTPSDPLSASCSLVGRGNPLVRQIMYGVDLRYELERFQFLGEFYRLENDARPGVGDGRSHAALAYFAQFGFYLTDKLKATYRYEALDFDNKPGDVDSFFMDTRLLARDQIGTDQRNVFCLRYDFSESNALMLEVSKTKPQLADSVTTTILSWAFVMY